MTNAQAFVRAHWPRLLASGALVAVLLGNQGFRSLATNWLELRRLRGEITELKREEARQAERMKFVKSGDAALERLARRELGFIKKGEIEYRFPPPKSAR